MQCPVCRKTLPTHDRFCAYCGVELGWRLLPGVSVPRLSLPARWKVTGALAAVLGALAGAIIAVPFGSLWAGVFVGALGLGASAMLAEVVTAAIPDRRSAERFGQAMGVLGGGLVLPGGMLTGVIISLWGGGPRNLGALGALLVAGLYLGLICGVGGAVIGAAGGVIVGGLAGRLGQAMLRRRGAILGAAAAWTVATVLGGLFAGDFAGRIAGARSSATAGVIVQVLVGALLLLVVRRVQRRWQAWWTGRP
jgi:hypothetical protein